MVRKPLFRWDGIKRVFRLLLFFMLLFVTLQIFIDPYSNPLYVGDHNRMRSACESNMKQLGLALMQYSQDNDDTLPSAMTADGHGWREAIYPYVKSPRVYRCPDDKRGGSQDSPGNLPKSYGANAAVMTGKKTDTNPASITAMDMRGYNGEDWKMTSPAFLPDSDRELYAHVPRHLFYEHSDGILNCLFADGHVKAWKPMATLTPVNLWTRDNSPFTGQDLSNVQAILKHAENE